MSKGVSEYLGFLQYVKRCVRIFRIFMVCQKVSECLGFLRYVKRCVRIFSIFMVCQKVFLNT